MVVLKETPDGIDIPIQMLQQELFDHLLIEWGITGDQFNFYGRAYRNQKKGPEDGYVPEVYVGKREYRDAYLDDKVAATAFFTNPERITNDAPSGQSVATLALIFSVNIEKLTGVTAAHRADEEVQQIVTKFFADRPAAVAMTERINGIQNVLAEYSFYRNSSRDRFKDMQPWLHFRYNLELTYNINDCYTNLFIN